MKSFENWCQAIHRELQSEYPDSKPLLNFNSPFQLLIATVLAAQCTDEQVNKVTPRLFRRFPTPEALGKAELSELEEIIHSTGFFVNKARNIRKTGAMIAQEFNGSVPTTLEELITLPGVGRKTANVMLAVCFKGAAIIVDTHFKRVSRRIGLTGEENPDKIEKELRIRIPEELQTPLSMEINRHGRYCCKARGPECYRCRIRELCQYTEKS